MKKDLLICIAFHYNKERAKYLLKVLSNFLFEYKCSLKIIIDTNEKKSWEGIWPLVTSSREVEVCYHTELEHPFHLTSIHRHHIKDNIDNYENFMYIENDILVPYENYLNYLENFKLLYPKYVPSFIRIEEKGGVEYVSDVLEKQNLNVISIGDKVFTALPFPYNYHGFWIMPQKELRESINEDFIMLSDGREFNAMWVGWGLGKPALVEIENGQVSEKCYSYHLPNNYALANGCKNGKIKAKEIFI